jgi:hypothetical protein
MVCPSGKETAAGSESAAGKQVAPVLGAREGEKAATGMEQSAGMVCPPREEETAGLQSSNGGVIAPAPEARVPPVGPVGQPVAARPDELVEVFDCETDGVVVAEALLRLLPGDHTTDLDTPDIHAMAREERWPIFDEEAEEEVYCSLVTCLLDAAQRGVLTTINQADALRLARPGVEEPGGKERPMGPAGVHL